MVKKVLKRSNFKNSLSIKEDLSYWLSRPTEERISAVEYLRKQYYGSTARLQRVVSIIQFPQS